MSISRNLGDLVLGEFELPSSSLANALPEQTDNAGKFLTTDGTNETWGNITESNDLSSSVTWANVPDTNITESSVTQHQAALSITESQISDFGSYVTTLGAQALATASALTLSGNTLTLTKGNGTTDTVDLSAYLDEDARAIASGVLAADTGIVTFTRDDASEFTLDLSALLDDTNLVTSVAGKSGVVTLEKADITDFSDSDYATALQGELADTSLQPNDNVSSLVNDAGYLTSETADVLTSLSLASNTLTYTDEAGAATDIDLSAYLDDTDTYVTSGALTANTLTLTLSDASTVAIDISDIVNTSLATSIIAFDTGYTITGSEPQGTLFWDADNETLAVVEDGSVLQIGQELHYHVTKHGSAQDIPNGMPVVAVGTTGGSGKVLACAATVAEFNTCTGLSVTEIPAKYVIGVATEIITNNGAITSFGKVNDVTGANYTEGTVYYVDEINGGLTSTKPTTGLVMPIAFAINSDTLMVRTTPINERLVEEGVTAYGWGDHSTAGYLTSYTETDPVYTASSWYTTPNNAANWETAYAWGDHATAGYLTVETSHDDVLVDGDFTSSGFMKTDGSGNYSVDTNTYLTSETSHADVLVDGDFTSSGIMTTDGAGNYSVDSTAYLPLTGGTLSGGINVTGTVESDELVVVGDVTLKGYYPTGTSNIGIGPTALNNSLTGSNNVALGNSTLSSLTTGGSNFGAGLNALSNLTTGSSNFSVGASSSKYNTTGNWNTSIGELALMNNISGHNNTAIGRYACMYQETGSSNIAIGALNLRDNVSGSYNVAVGNSTLTSNTGSSNVGIGSSCLSLNTTGQYNYAMGTSALYNSTTGSNNIAIGYYAGNKNTTASYNTSIGYRSGYNTTTGGSNIFVGQEAGYNVTTGMGNTFVGKGAGYNMATGSYNTIVGSYSGNNATLNMSDLNGYIALSNGYGAIRMYCDNLGNWTATGNINAVNFNSTSDATLKTNVETLTGSLDAVKALRGVSFDWVENGNSEVGVIAQEVEAVIPELVSTNDKGIKSVKYGNVVAVLIEAIKEQQAQIDELKSKLGAE